MPYPILKTVALSIAGFAIAFSGLSTGAEDAQSWKAPRREAGRKNPIPPEPNSTARGKTLYANTCEMCHGQRGKGDGPKGIDLQPRPSDLTSAQIAAESDGTIFWKITTGRRPMPAFEKEIPAEDRWHLVNYLRTLGPGKQ